VTVVAFPHVTLAPPPPPVVVALVVVVAFWSAPPAPPPVCVVGVQAEDSVPPDVGGVMVVAGAAFVPVMFCSAGMRSVVFIFYISKVQQRLMISKSHKVLNCFGIR
jgi:hypothetical protein